VRWTSTITVSPACSSTQKAVALKYSSFSLVFSATMGVRAAYGMGQFGGMRYKGLDSQIVDSPVDGRFLCPGVDLGGSMYF
jgi:hypothetical protein